MIPVDAPDLSTPDPTAHLHTLADLTTAVVEAIGIDDADAFADLLLCIGTGAPSRAYALGRAGVVLGAVELATLDAARVQAVAAFIESGLATLDEPTRHATIAAIQSGAEPVVTFRPLTGSARLVLMTAGHPPVELVRLTAAAPTVH
jgi:hypothetical protein